MHPTFNLSNLGFLNCNKGMTSDDAEDLVQGEAILMSSTQARKHAPDNGSALPLQTWIELD